MIDCPAAVSMGGSASAPGALTAGSVVGSAVAPVVAPAPSTVSSGTPVASGTAGLGVVSTGWVVPPAFSAFSCCVSLFSRLISLSSLASHSSSLWIYMRERREASQDNGDEDGSHRANDKIGHHLHFFFFIDLFFMFKVLLLHLTRAAQVYGSGSTIIEPYL